MSAQCSTADLIEAIETKLAALAPGIAVSTGVASVQGTRATTAPSMARQPTTGQPETRVVQVAVEAPSSRNRNLDREGPDPHVMVEDSVVLSLSCQTKVSDPRGTRRAMLEAEQKILDLLYGDHFARVYRLRYLASTRSFAAPTSGTMFTTTMNFTRSHQ